MISHLCQCKPPAVSFDYLKNSFEFSFLLDKSQLQILLQCLKTDRVFYLNLFLPLEFFLFKGLGKRGHMFPETCFRNCFLVLPCFHAARKHEMFLPCSRSKSCFSETKLTLETMLPVWQNWETLGKHARATSVSGNMFTRFARP